MTALFMEELPKADQAPLKIMITAEVEKGGRCQINLQTGQAPYPEEDITLHISIRPSEGVIVRNHMVGGIWGHEERGGGCPVRERQGFQIWISVETLNYKISINGTEYCKFDHRVPPSWAEWIKIQGECAVRSVEFGI